MYENTKSCVRINYETSVFFLSECAVRLVENLSPRLFSLYLNDLENVILSGGDNSIDLDFVAEETQVCLKLLNKLYADDTVIFSNDKIVYYLEVKVILTSCIIFNLRTNRNGSFT